MTLFKPTLAKDFDEKKITFPVYCQPKIDGVRGMVQNGQVYARSLKLISNQHIQNCLGRALLNGIDGEFAVGPPYASDVLFKTTSGVGSTKGEPDFTLWVFDMQFEGMSYANRYSALVNRIDYVRTLDPHIRIQVVPSVMVKNMQQLLEMEATFLADGYEGMIIRSPHQMYKEGRSGAKEMHLIRVKRFVEEEGVVVELLQGTTNVNEATTNELGRTTRSTAQAGKVLQERLGAMMVRQLSNGKVGKVSTGHMTSAEGEAYWNNPETLLGKTIKFKHFPKGVKDKNRFPSFVCLRLEEDMS